MNLALAGLFQSLSTSPAVTFDPGTNKDRVLAAMERLGGRAYSGEIVAESGLDLNQVQYALRYMVDHKLAYVREIPRGIGRSFEYRLPHLVQERTPTLMTRVLAELSERGPSSARVLADKLDVPERTMSTTLSYAFSKQKLIRTKVLGVWAYSVPGHEL